jgi:hypothetical protein|tara:strand:- start:98 stop:502 length:405 start_codon:yes stop_codon:yes gene_type:complete
MPNLLKECREADCKIMFIIGRPKDANVVCYSLDDSCLGIGIYWRLINGSNYPISLIEKSLAIGVCAVTLKDGSKKCNLVSFPQLHFTVKLKKAYRNNKQIQFVFCGPPSGGFFNIRPAQLFIRYTNGETEIIDT